MNLPETYSAALPIHPGEILKEEFLEGCGLSQFELARRINVPPPRINAIVLGKRRISADTALRLSRFFGNSVAFWLNMQNHYDVEVARANLASGLDKIEPFEYTDPDSQAAI